MLALIQEAFILKLNKAINNYLEQIKDLDPSVSKKLSRLEQKTVILTFKLMPVSLKYKVIFENLSVKVKPDNDLHPESDSLSIVLSPGSLIRAKLTGFEDSVRYKDIEMTGDLNIAMELQSIVNNLDFDHKLVLQENIAHYTSDSFAWQFMNIVDKILERVNIKHSELKEQITDYLQTEKNILISKSEIEEFYLNVDKLRDDMSRLEARIDMLC